MPKHFKKTIEYFTCENCGFKVKGTGYTNHCPKCLWSKHVDLEVPGDRSNPCQGTMEPVGMELKRGEYIIVHHCQTCSQKTRNKTAEEDDFEEILKYVAGLGVEPSL